MTKKKNEFPEEYKAIGAIPPGKYTGKITKIRKARGKPFYRMELTLANGCKVTSILPCPKEDK